MSFILFFEREKYLASTCMCGSAFAHKVSDSLHALHSVVRQAKNKHKENKHNADHGEAVPAELLF